MTRTGNTGQVVTGVIGAFHNNFFKIKYSSECEQWFLYYFLTSRKIQHTILKLAGTSTIPDLNHNDFYKIPITLPSLPEQQKIASFLSAVDKKIQQLTRKKELLEQYKKGVIQKLFSQEIRFKDENGKDYPDWEEKRLGDVFDGSKGQGLSKNQIVEEGNNKCILYGELYTTYDEVIKEVRSLTNSTKGVKSETGDLLIPCSTTTTGIDLANATVINEDGVLIGGDVSILRLKNDGDSIFFAYYLTHFKKYDIAKYAQGSTIIHLYFNHFKKTNLTFPSVKEEQTKIANLISNIVKKIESVQTQITQTQQFKKGLLQQMFV
jgi:type I restriction enzyme S subunit